MKKIFKAILCQKPLAFVCLLLAGTLLNSTVYGLPYPPITYLGIEQGLSNNSVRSIYQDAKGFMWFGSFDGLNRFDGYTFKVFRTDSKDPNSLVHNYLNCITGDSQGNLWIGTRQGLSAYDGLLGKFRTISYIPAGSKTPQKLLDVIKALKTTSDDTVLIGTEGTGLLLCGKNAAIARQVPLQLGNTLQFKYSVRTIKIVKGRTWVFVQNVGICEFDPVAQRLLLKCAVQLPAVSMGVEGDDIWITSELLLCRYSISANRYSQELDLATYHFGPSPIVTLTIDSKKQLWMGRNGDGIVIYDPQTHAIDRLVSGDRKNCLSNGSIYSIYEDKEARKWIGTDRGGINIIDPRKSRFQLIQHDPADAKGLNSNVIQTFYEDPAGLIWIGSEDKGISVWNRTSNSFTTFQNNPGDPHSLSQNNIRCIMGDHTHTVWIATFSGGINRYNAATHQFDRYPFNNPVNGNRNEAIHTIYEDRNDDLWVGTLRQGDKNGALYRFNRTTNTFDLFDPDLSDLITIKEDRTGDLWGGNLDHLVRIDKHNRQHQSYLIGFSIWHIYQDKDDYLWIATEGGGLFQFDIHKNVIVRRYTTADGLPSSSVLKIIDTGDGYFWISTYNGLSRFDVAGKTFKNYYQSDGLQSNQFQYNAALKLHSGELIFGGVKGFNLFSPKQITPITNQPALLLTGITVNSVSLEKDPSFIDEKDSTAIKAIRVPYNKAILSFDFTALEYSSPRKITYAYYLEGWDRKWNYTTDVRTASYTHLSEGNYVLRVKNTNTEGAWNPQQIALSIVVLPPWYRTWWAYLLYVLCMGSLLYLYFSYKSKQARLSFQLTIAQLNEEKALAERNKERAELEKERVLNEKEKEINEKRLTFFTNISHEFRTPLTLIINPAKELIGQVADPQEASSGLLRVIYRNARRMLSLVDQLLLFRKAESETDKVHAAKLNGCHLCREVYLSFTQQAKGQQITYDFECDNEALEIYADREKLEIILYNLISNAMKYTPAGGHIRFSVVETETEVEIAVADNGYGIPAAVGNKLFEKFYQAEGKGIRKPGFGIGLYLVKHFTELHHGTVTYESELEKGTIFRISLLKGKDHFLPEQIDATATEGPGLLHELTGKADEVEELQETTHAFPGAGELVLESLVTEKKSMVIVDDDVQIRQYLVSIFKNHFTVHEAENGARGLELARTYQPDIVISDIKMEGITGIDLCKTIKEDPATSHIPVILLTGTSSPELKLEGVEGGADDYITKPFDVVLLVARVNSLLKNRSNLQQYFYGEITLSNNNFKVSEEYKAFLEKCIAIVEKHLDDDHFNVKTFIAEMGMSRSNLFRKVKEVSGLSINVFIRFIRLRKGAELLINTNHNVNETAALVGIIDVQYFREQFTRLFGMKPSEYIKKYRKPFEGRYKVNRESFRPGKG
jgi:signal transduction histidine kinase/ligand-binding sensor domain-containing protein/DNA-binding response OmpR family regulator